MIVSLLLIASFLFDSQYIATEAAWLGLSSSRPPKVTAKKGFTNIQYRGSRTFHLSAASILFDFTEEEKTTLNDLHSTQKSEITEEERAIALQQTLKESLTGMNPNLVVKLRKLAAETIANPEELKVDAEQRGFVNIAVALESLVNGELQQAKQLLADLLDAGELRKLDALIGKAATAGKLDVPFFNVLNMNLKDAAGEDAKAEGPGLDENGNPKPSRFQILQHIYTRCEEEVEKQLPPGRALLNKLLRTPQDSIRRNLYEHYLCPQAPPVITAPDGKELELKPTAAAAKAVLVNLPDFVTAIAETVKQIRSIERAGGTERGSAANMVEMVRHIAKESRVIILENYGEDSEEVKQFQEELEPVFRPSSRDSPYSPNLPQGE